MAQKKRNARNSKSSKRKRRMSNKTRISLIAALMLVFAAVWILIRFEYITVPDFLKTKVPEPLKPGTAEVHFIDVGQGDCELIVTPDAAVLIDSGESEYSSRVINYIKSRGISRLDYVIATHPHSDHIGGLGEIIKEFDVGTFIMPEIPGEFIPTTYCYENLLDALKEKDCEVRAAKTETVTISDSAALKIITSDYFGDNLNNYSPAVKFICGFTSFLFSGDLESDMETAILLKGEDISADVYKLAHHGSSTSNSAMWLAAVDPDYCVCECGAGNSYGHPDKETVDAALDYADILLRTDLNGTVVFMTDGNTITYETER